MYKYLPYLFISLLLVTPSLVFAGPICDSFLTCLPFSIALAYTYFVIISGPFLLAIGLLGFLILRLKYPTSYKNTRILLLAIGLIGLSFVLVVPVSYYKNLQENKISYNKKIQTIEQYNFQIHKLTYLPNNYRASFYHYSDNSYSISRTAEKNINFSVKTEIEDNGGQLWATVWQFNVEDTKSFPQCPQQITEYNLNVENCTYLETTEKGTIVYGQKSFNGKDVFSILALKNNTGLFIKKDISDFVFSEEELAELYKIIDGLEPISIAEMQNYSEYLFDNISSDLNAVR